MRTLILAFVFVLGAASTAPLSSTTKSACESVDLRGVCDFRGE